jgi:hypothetical protein
MSLVTSTVEQVFTNRLEYFLAVNPRICKVAIDIAKILWQGVGETSTTSELVLPVLLNTGNT